MATGAGRKALLNYLLSFIPNTVRLPPIYMIRYEWYMDSASGFLAGIFSGGKIYCYGNFYCFLTKISLGGEQKCLHLRRGLLRNETEVEWHSVRSTMTSIVGEVTQTYS